MTSLARDTRDSMASTPSVVAQELAEVRDLKALAEECGWDDNSKEYKDRMASINKKYKALMKMGSMTVSMQGGSSSAKQTKQNFIWVDSAKRDAGDMEEAAGLLPEVFGEGKYGTSGVNSRGGKQKYKGEECVWKRVSKDGKHYRIFQHSTGYFYQKGFLPSDTEEQHEEQENEEDKDGEGDDDELEEEKGEEEEEAQPPSKKAKGGKGAKAPAKAPKAVKGAPKASPKRSSMRGHK
jgi:hypothetical protein